VTGETIGAIGYGAVAGGLFLADATGAIPDLGGFDIGQISSIGFAVWYGWYVTCRAIPKIIDQNNEAAKAVAVEHRQTVAVLTETFKEEMSSVRDARERDREHFRCEKESQR
jgi:hypothetical protein